MAIKRSDRHGFPWFSSLQLLDKILFKPHHIIVKMYITMSGTFIRLIHCNTLKFQEKPSLRTGQKYAL